jgi:hypothetical protein
MALAAAVMKAVNSSLYGLKGRVQSVHQAITYLGMREVAAITFELGLRAAFPPAPGTGAAVAARRPTRPADGAAGQRGCRWTPGPHIRRACSRSVARRCCSGMPPTTTRPCCAQPPTTPNSGGAGTRRLWRQPRRIGRGAVRQLGAGRGGGGQRAPPRGRASHAAIARTASWHGGRSAPCRCWPHVLRRHPDDAGRDAQGVAPQADLDPTLVLRALRQLHEQLDAAAANGRECLKGALQESPLSPRARLG